MDPIVNKIKDTLVMAGSTFTDDKKWAYRRAIAREENTQAKWVLESILENALVAEKNRSPLCDDTGIPHLFLEVGKERSITGATIESIYRGIECGLNELPGRPMAVMGNDRQRIDQSCGLDSNSSAVVPAPIQVRVVEGDSLRLHILMFGGGPAIRAKTYRVYHQHKFEVVVDEIISWAIESVKLLGCTPATLAVGIGRSHYEATSLMLKAQVYGNYDCQSDVETLITDRVNQAEIGALGLGGKTSVLATFLKIGPQRASGVRIVSMRPCCCFEPRIARVDL